MSDYPMAEEVSELEAAARELASAVVTYEEAVRRFSNAGAELELARTQYIGTRAALDRLIDGLDRKAVE